MSYGRGRLDLPRSLHPKFWWFAASPLGHAEFPFVGTLNPTIEDRITTVSLSPAKSFKKTWTSFAVGKLGLLQTGTCLLESDEQVPWPLVGMQLLKEHQRVSCQICLLEPPLDPHGKKWGPVCQMVISAHTVSQKKSQTKASESSTKHQAKYMYACFLIGCVFEGAPTNGWLPVGFHVASL